MGMKREWEIWAVRLPAVTVKRILGAMKGTVFTRSQFLRMAIEAGFRAAEKAARAMR